MLGKPSRRGGQGRGRGDGRPASGKGKQAFATLFGKLDAARTASK